MKLKSNRPSRPDRTRITDLNGWSGFDDLIAW